MTIPLRLCFITALMLAPWWAWAQDSNSTSVDSTPSETWDGD